MLGNLGAVVGSTFKADAVAGGQLVDINSTTILLTALVLMNCARCR